MKKVCVNKKIKHTFKEDLEKLSKDELISRILQLEAHNLQLKNIIQKQVKDETLNRKNNRKFDFSNKPKRHVLLKFLYFGWDYQGYVCQEDSVSTIEYHLFNALQKTCLIESRETSNYHRCGRTDKGVSAFSQVVSIDLRSNFPRSEQLDEEKIKNEIDYCSILNRILPENIKCIAWMPLRNGNYSARFDCIQRTYHYYFPAGDLNIEKMNEACHYLLGTHDFRNLCKMDVGNGVTNFVRTISLAAILPCKYQSNLNSGYEMFYLQITSQGFLWHQIRCIMAILILIGKLKEKPTVIEELFDVEKNPCKPQYSLSHSLPLNLYACEFRHKSIKNVEDSIETKERDENKEDKDLMEWVYSEVNLSKLIKSLQRQWGVLNIQATMIKEVANDIEQLYSEKNGPNVFKNQADVLELGARPKIYQTLLNRKRCESLENRMDHYIKRQKLTVEGNKEGIKA